MTRSFVLLISDYAGHPFTYELANSLNQAHFATAYSYCSTTVSPRGSLRSTDLAILPVHSGRRFDKYNPIRRVGSELWYGWGTGRAVWKTRPRVHIVANMPIVSLFVVWLVTLPLRGRLVIWLQDVQSGLAAGILGDRFVARALSRVESFLLKRAHRVVAISPELESEASRRGVKPNRLAVVENWAPIESISVQPRENPWARKHQLDTGLVYLYSGTLARKHNPSMLIELARAVRTIDARVVVVSEGEGASFIGSAIADDPTLDNVHIFPYQAFDDLPEVLGTADVLLVLLEPIAGAFSVPSKTLSYLCAGRPILAAMPPSNTAGVIIAERSAAGVVVEPADVAGFCDAALRLAASPVRRAELGARARAYAERHFSAETVIAAMLAEIRAVGQ